MWKWQIRIKKREYLRRRKSDLTREFTLISLAVLLMSALSINIATVGSYAVDGVFLGGSGTADDPYMIYDVHDLQNMSADLTAHYALANDIDASETKTWNDGDGFEPVGAGPWHAPFSFNGSLDGRGYKIKRLFTNRPETDYLGLLGHISEEGIVKNVGLVDVNIARDQVMVVRSGSSVELMDEEGPYLNRQVGGLAGINRGTISNSYSQGSVLGGSTVGGLVGRNYENISESYATGDVDGLYTVGGLVGDNTDSEYVTFLDFKSEVWNCYAAGTVSGISKVGGLIGHNDGLVFYSFASGHVSGSSDIGGLIGDNRRGSVNASFWDVETSDQTESAAGEGKTTSEMMDVNTFVDADWKIVFVDSYEDLKANYTWNIVDGETYPFLNWEEEVSETDDTGAFLPIWLILMIIVVIVALVLTLIFVRKRGKKVTKYESEDVWSTDEEL